MSEELRNKNSYQFFGEVTYRCVPPIFRNYKLYIISGLNLIIEKKDIMLYINS